MALLDRRVAFIAALLPTSVMPLADPLAQNRVYFALAGISVGVGLIAGAGFRSAGAGRAGQFMVAVCSIILLAMFMLLNLRQQDIWSSQVKLWTEAIHNDPENVTDNYSLSDVSSDGLPGFTN